jgi:hypothetical protein
MPRRSRATREGRTEEVDCGGETELVCAGRKFAAQPPKKISSAVQRSIRRHFILSVDLNSESSHFTPRTLISVSHSTARKEAPTPSLTVLRRSMIIHS